jgi:hypothetical protein
MLSCSHSLAQRVEQHVHFADESQKQAFAVMIRCINMHTAMETLVSRIEQADRKKQRLLTDNRNMKNSITEIMSKKHAAANIFPEHSRYAKILQAKNPQKRILYSRDPSSLN